MRNMAVLHSPAFSYPLPVLVRVLFNLLIFKGKILYYNKYSKKTYKIDSYSKKISPWDNNYLKDLQICFKHLPSTGNINV